MFENVWQVWKTLFNSMAPLYTMFRSSSDLKHNEPPPLQPLSRAIAPTGRSIDRPNLNCASFNKKKKKKKKKIKIKKKKKKKKEKTTWNQPGQIPIFAHFRYTNAHVIADLSTPSNLDDIYTFFRWV